MKVAHIVRRYSRAEWGGTETVVSHLCEEQRRSGDEPRIFATNALQPSGGTDECETFGYWYPYFPMPEADRLKLDKKGGNPYSPALFRAVERFKPDAIHIHAGGRLASAAVKLAKRLGVPSVVSVHGGAAATPKREMELMLEPLKGKLPLGGIIDRLLGLRFDAIGAADAVLALSHEEVCRLRETHPGRRIEYVPNGVPDIAERERMPRKEFRKALCVSRIDYQKNQLAIVEMLAAVPGTEARLVGPVTAPWYLEEIKRRANELGVEDRLKIVPGLAPGSAELEAEFDAADFFVLPSVHEPFGIVALEAMQRGVPLVAAATGGIKDFAKDGENAVLFDPAEVDGLARAVGRLEPELAAKIAAGGKETARGYSWREVAKRIREFYVKRRTEAE